MEQLKSDTSGAMVADESQMYEMFDDMALEVMQRNCAVLEEMAENTNDVGGKVQFRCDVVTPQCHKNRGNIGASCTIDLATVLAQVVEHQTQSKALPSDLCCVDSIIVEDATNTLPVDLHVGCRLNNESLGHYVRGRNPYETGTEANEGPKLFVLHSGASIHPSGGRVVHTANDFVDGEHFKTYLHALDGDIEDSATIINGGNAVEYLSPTAQLTGDSVVKGDYLVNIMYKNPLAFKNYVQAIRTPVTDSTGDGEDKYKFSLRMHTDDWDNLNRAVQANVIQPLRKNIINMKTNPKITFDLMPDITTLEDGSPGLLKNRANVEKWNSELLKDHSGRATVSMLVTMRFV